MNHLVGLDVECPTKSLSPSEEAALAAFRGAHEAARPIDYHSQHSDNDDGMMDESSHQVNPSDLPSCGWRPLDDATLYRFLCADRRNGKFQLEKSQARLRKALSFRKEAGVDDILISTAAAAAAAAAATAQTVAAATLDNPIAMKKGPSPRSVTISYNRCDSNVSLTSVASGTISDCGEKIQDIARVAPAPTPSTAAPSSKSLPPLPPSSNKAKASPERGVADEIKDGTEHSVATATSSSTVASTTNAAPKINLRDLERYQRLRVRVFVGRDHQGQPVLFERLGHFLGSGNCDHFTEEEWIKFYIWDLERHFTEMRSASEESGKAITRFTYVADADGIYAGIMNRAVWRVIPLLKALVKAVEEHYPEIADKIVLFNVPRIASVFYRAVKTFLDPITAEKIELHSGVPTAEFERIMPRSVIPIEYGGTNNVHFPPAVTEA